MIYDVDVNIDSSVSDEVSHITIEADEVSIDSKYANVLWVNGARLVFNDTIVEVREQ